MKHLTDEFDAWRFIGILLFKVHDEPKGPILKGGIGRPDDDCVPVIGALVAIDRGIKSIIGDLPSHHIICNGRGRDACGGVGLHSL